MKKTTSENLSKRLANYGALTAAIIGTAGANGQNIIYTDVNPDFGAPGEIYFLDLNGDGTNDFILEHFTNSSYGKLKAFNNSSGLGNAIIGASVSSGYFNYPFTLSSNYTISAGNANWNANLNSQTLNAYSCSYSYSNWCGVTDKYLGLRFDIGGNTHYGWVRLDVDITTFNWKIKDYAYEATAGVPIVTPDPATLSVTEKLFDKIKIIALNKTIGLYNLPESTDYKLYSITGQSILEGKTNKNMHVIEAGTVASGLYILEIKDNTSNSVLKKKVVL